MKTKSTQGKWKYSQETKMVFSLDKNGMDDKGICLVNNESDAELITEAGNVANETGLTPMKLLEQRNEMLEALKKAQYDIMNYISNKYKATEEKKAIEELNSDPTYQSILNAIKQATESN